LFSLYISLSPSLSLSPPPLSLSLSHAILKQKLCIQALAFTEIFQGRGALIIIITKIKKGILKTSKVSTSKPERPRVPDYLSLTRT
jgi:hypothetical protein